MDLNYVLSLLNVLSALVVCEGSVFGKAGRKSSEKRSKPITPPRESILDDFHMDDDFSQTRTNIPTVPLPINGRPKNSLHRPINTPSSDEGNNNNNNIVNSMIAVHKVDEIDKIDEIDEIDEIELFSTDDPGIFKFESHQNNFNLPYNVKWDIATGDQLESDDQVDNTSPPSPHTGYSVPDYRITSPPNSPKQVKWSDGSFSETDDLSHYFERSLHIHLDQDDN